MRVTILPNGIGSKPVVLEATLVVCEHDNGTPFMVAGNYGPEGAERASHALDDDFNDTLRKMGVNKTVITDKLQLPPPPPGARIIRGPGR